MIKKISISHISLVINNLVPLLGALYLDWSLFTIMLIYWAESGVVGIFNILKLYRIGGEKFFKYTGIFIFSFGMFMFVHYIAILIFGIFADEVKTGHLRDVLFSPIYSDPEIIISIIFMFISHGVSYLKNFLHNMEYLVISIDDQVRIPFRRVMLMQAAILLSAFILVSIKPDMIIAIVVLITLKSVADFRAHVREHRVSTGTSK